MAHELESGRIDAVINVLDTTNLERNLLLTMQAEGTEPSARRSLEHV